MADDDDQYSVDPYSAFPSDDDDPRKMLAGFLSPQSAQSLVPTPPDTPPRVGPAQSTPQTGSIATTPQQATPKVSGPAMLPGRAALPETIAAKPAQTAQPLQPAQAANPAQMASANPVPNAPLRPAGTGSAMPAVQPAQPTQLSRDQAVLNYLKNSGSGISQIKNPFLRGLARVGDVAGSIIAPGAAAMIPGTTLHHQVLVGQQRGIVSGDQAQQQAAAQTADTQSQADERRAKMQQDIANAGKADRFDPNAAKTVDTGDGVFQLNPDTGRYDIRIGASSKNPQEGERPLGSSIPNLNKTLSDRYQVLNPGKLVPPQYQLPPTATQKDYDRVDKALAGVEGAQGTQAQRATANAMRQQALTDAEAARANAGNAGLDRETARLAKPYEAANTAASTQLDKIDDARAMVNGNAEAQALGIPKVLTALVGGQGTGVRITTPELNAIARARGWAGDFQGTLNSISGKGKLTSTQQQQLTKILDDVKGRITQKRQIANDALDKINGASNRNDAISAEAEARQRLTALEAGSSNSAARDPNMIYARDPNGQLHASPKAGAKPLPSGWKYDVQPAQPGGR